MNHILPKPLSDKELKPLLDKYRAAYEAGGDWIYLGCRTDGAGNPLTGGWVVSAIDILNKTFTISNGRGETRTFPQ